MQELYCMLTIAFILKAHLRTGINTASEEPV